jgi:protein-S-isoprenylcysteine O-methyltransferase Ste14/CheY-like chemotaxis protein
MLQAAMLDIGRSGLALLFCGLTATLFLIRHTTRSGQAGPGRVAVALTGTLILSCIGLQPRTVHDSRVLMAADGLLISGLAWSIYAAASLGRCFGLVAEARGLVTSGAYGIVRHPLYLGEFVAACGLVLPVLTPGTALVFAVFCLCQIARAVMEERVLSGVFNGYLDYRRRTPAVLPWPRPSSTSRKHEHRALAPGDGIDQQGDDDARQEKCAAADQARPLPGTPDDHVCAPVVSVKDDPCAGCRTWASRSTDTRQQRHAFPAHAAWHVIRIQGGAAQHTGRATLMEHDGQQSANAVALVGIQQDIQDLLELILQEAGYTTAAYPLDLTTIASLAQAQPSVILAETGISATCLEFLDALRSDPLTAAIPVIVLSSIEPMQVQAQAAGNVYAALAEPFDLDELERALAGAIAHTPFEARIAAQPREADPLFTQAAELLLREQRSLMLAWVQQVRQVEPFRSRPDISTRAFLDSVPRILHALVLVLGHQAPPQVFERDDDMQQRIREHAQIRVQQGLTADAVVREYQVLRNVITARLERDLPAQSLLAVAAHLNEVLDEAMRITAGEYAHLASQGQAPESGGP